MALMVTMRCQPSGSASKNVTRGCFGGAAIAMPTPAQLTKMSSAPNASMARCDGALAIRALRHVAGGLQELAGEHRLGGEPLETVGVDVDAGDARARAGQRPRHHPAHAARRAGHHRDPAREHLLFCHCRLPFPAPDDDRSPPPVQLPRRPPHCRALRRRRSGC